MQWMLYAYIVIFLAQKCSLMRFYKAALIVLMFFMLVSGEFAGLVPIKFFGLPYIPGNWFTRALPYILLGKLLREKEGFLLRVATWKYLIIWAVGAELTIGELFLLGSKGFLVSQGHMVGYGVMAFAACGLALSKPLGNDSPTTAFFTHFDPALSGIMYILMEPLYYILGILILFILGQDHEALISSFGGLVAWGISILLAILLWDLKLFKMLFS